VLKTAPKAFGRLLSDRFHASELERHALPDSPGVYFVLVRGSNRVHYIGSSRSLRRRVYDQLLLGMNHAYWGHVIHVWHKFSSRKKGLEFARKNWIIRFLPTLTEDDTRALEYIAKR